MDLNNKLKVDVYAKIAVQCQKRWDDSLIEPQPPKLAKRFLPLSKKNLKAAFKPRPKLDSAEKLKRELAKQRRQYSKFLTDLAPRQKSMRKTIFLEEFDWRKQTKVDLKDFAANVLAGKGKWQKVHIPHYGGPTGRAVTFYRTTFNVTGSMLNKAAVFVGFKGVDYKAHVFVNGSFLGSHEGFFAPFEFDFTAVARVGKNTLVVKVENDFICMGNPPETGSTLDGDKIYASSGCSWDDPELGWQHCPPGMGIYQQVYIESRSPVHVRDVFVRPLPDNKRAEAWIEIYNSDIERRKVLLELSVFGQNFRKTVFRNKRCQPQTIQVPGLSDLRKPGDREVLDLLMGNGINYLKIPFEIPDACVWEPDSPWLYQIQVKLLDEYGRVFDTAKRQFGMRSFHMNEEGEPKGRFFLNGRQIKLRGAGTMGYMQQCVMRKDFKQLCDDILLARICNMNFLRLTQRPVQPEIYEYCDRLGLMTQTDLPLFGCLRRNQFGQAVKQSHEMERLVRSHPCNIIISYINEPFPNAYSAPHRFLTRSELHDFFKSADIAVRMANPDRVIKPVDGDYDPPAPGLPDNHCYNGWYIGQGLDMGKLHKGYWQRVKPGWLYACGEFGSEALSPVEVMRKYYPKKWLPQTQKEEKSWTADRITGAQVGRFHYMWYETPHTLQGWVNASQEHQRWVTQMMAEAFRRNNQMNSFAVHHFIDAFAAGALKTIMDVERNPKLTYFAYRDALAPVIVNLRTDRFAFFAGEQILLEAWVCNDLNHKLNNLTLHYQVEVKGNAVLAGKTPADVPALGSKFQGLLRFNAPLVDKRTKSVVRLALVERSGRVINDSSIDIDIFRALDREPTGRAFVVGSRQSEAAQLAKGLQMKLRFTGNIKSDEVILIDDFAMFERRKKAILAAVKKGAAAVFLQLPVGDFKIAGSTVRVEPCGMGSRHFVSRDTGHRFVEGFEPNDFKFWCDAKVGYVTPFLHTTFTTQDFEAILTSGNGDWTGNWSPALTAAECRLGKGSILIVQLELANRVAVNPVAKIFASRLLGIDNEV